MTNWRIPSGGARIASYGADTATTNDILLTAGGSAHTKGAWTEIASSTAFTCDWLRLGMTSRASSSAALIDIGIGAAGSEVVILENLPLACGSGLNGVDIFIPITIPAGTRLSARMQSTSASTNAGVYVIIGANGFGRSESFKKVITIGANTATSFGTSLSDGANWTAHTKKGWVEMTASAPDDIDAIIVLNSHLSASGGASIIDIGVGAAASESVIIPNVFNRKNNNSRVGMPGANGPFFVSIEKGTRIAARGQVQASSTATASDFYLVLLGLVR